MLKEVPVAHWPLQIVQMEMVALAHLHLQLEIWFMPVVRVRLEHSLVAPLAVQVVVVPVLQELAETHPQGQQAREHLKMVEMVQPGWQTQLQELQVLPMAAADQEVKQMVLRTEMAAMERPDI
jgi:hypothetical protein